MQPEGEPSADVLALLRRDVGRLPAGDVTFVFTDLEGSTRLLRDLGADYAPLLATHQALVARAMHDHGGFLVSAEGDEMFFAFPDATGAVAGTIAAQRAMTHYPWPRDACLRVRAGLHSGSARPLGTSYVALAVHQAARISAAAHGGQVVCSSITADLAGSLPDGVTEVPLGRFRLKDFQEPVALVELAYDTRSHPPLKTPPESVRRVPVPRTSFVGRAEEFVAVRGLLLDHALVTLCGPGGAGKTRLALEVASSSPGEQEVVVVELAASTPDQVLTAVAAALDLEQSESLLASIEEAVRGRELLLVLDNCEHVLDAVADVVALTASSQELRVLATSREPLQVPQERVVRLAPLPVPPLGASLEVVVQHAGARLLLDRVMSQDPQFTVTEDDAEALATLVTELDGLPLAVELVAARVATDGLAEVVASLGDDDLLSGRGRPDRHRSMEAALRWSEGLLSPAEQEVWHTLAVFRGAFTADAADQVCGTRVRTCLAALVNKSLVQRVDAGDSLRYRLHQRVREYGLSRLTDDVAVRDRHAEWASDRMRVDDGSAEDFRYERDDCVAAWEHAWSSGQAVRFSALGANLAEHDMTRGRRRSEAVARLAQLESLEPSPDTAGAFSVAALAWHEDEPERAIRLADAALAHSHEPLVVAAAWRAKALAQVMLYEVEAAAATLAQIAAAPWYAGDGRTRTVVEGTLAMVAEMLGDLDGALEHARQFLQLAVDSDHLINIGRAHNMLAWLLQRSGAPADQVRAELALSVEATQAADDEGGLVALLTLQAELETPDRARELTEEALEKLQQMEAEVDLMEADGLFHALTAAQAPEALAALLGVAEVHHEGLPGHPVAYYAAILERVREQVAPVPGSEALRQRGRAAAQDGAALLLELLRGPA